jgi:hypothetical protein
MMTNLLKGVVQEGTGTAANIGIPQAGKTGTADDYRNAWFIGFTPSIVAGVWVGNDDNSPMDHVTGGSLPAQTWAVFVKQILPTLAKDDWTAPDGVVQQTVCEPDPGSTTCTNRLETFIKGTEPEGTVSPVVPTAPTTVPTPPTPPSQGPSGAPVPTPGVPVVVLQGPSGTGSALAEPAAPHSAAPDGVSGAAAAAGPAASAAHQSRVMVPIVITAPRRGSVVGLPLVVTGTSRPGTLVHLTVVSKSGALRVPTEDTYIKANESGAFTYEIYPRVQPVDGTLVITAAAAAGPNGEVVSGAAMVAVQIR